MASITLTVTGMHCIKCETRVQKFVGALEGVESVKADAAANSVELTYDGTEQTLAAVKETISGLDFVVED